METAYWPARGEISDQSKSVTGNSMYIEREYEFQSEQITDSLLQQDRTLALNNV